MSEQEDNKQPEQPVEEQKELTPEEERELKMKKRIEELRKRDPFIYR